MKNYERQKIFLKCLFNQPDLRSYDNEIPQITKLIAIKVDGLLVYHVIGFTHPKQQIKSYYKFGSHYLTWGVNRIRNALKCLLIVVMLAVQSILNQRNVESILKRL